MWAGYTSGIYPLIESSGMLGGLMINDIISVQTVSVTVDILGGI